MSRILLADDSPHAQRMGELILREEGYEVVSLTDGDTVLVRLEDVDPDLILADVSLPAKNGYEICEFVKHHPKHGHVGVLLTAGAMEAMDEQEAQRVGADGTLRKPFEASVVLETVKPLVEAAQQARSAAADEQSAQQSPSVAPDEPALDEQSIPEEPEPAPPATPAGPAADPQAVRAAVTIALESALPVLIDEISQRVLLALAEDASPLPQPAKAEPMSAG